MSVEETPPSDSHPLLAVRREKLDALRATGTDPFGTRFDTDGTVGQIRERFAEGTVFRLAGRVTAHRDMGRSHFLDLSDLTGRWASTSICASRRNCTSSGCSWAGIRRCSS